MRKRIVKLTIALFIIVTLVLITKAVCFPAPPADMTAVETVEYYFDQFDQGDRFGMNSVVILDKYFYSYKLGHLNYGKLISCEEAYTNSPLFEDIGYQDAYDTTVVDVEFEISYDEDAGATGEFQNGTNAWHYYLVKEKETSDWKIIKWGFYV